MNLLFATGNSGKLREARAILSRHVVNELNIEMTEPHELGHEAIVKSKAKQALAEAKAPVFVEDTAFYLNAFNDFPGVYGKYIANAINMKGVLKLVEGEDRGARFETLLAYITPNEEIKIFKGVCNGKIAECERGEKREHMPYDLVFIPNGFSETFSEMSYEKKNELSHRRKAMQSFAEWLK